MLAEPISVKKPEFVMSHIRICDIGCLPRHACSGRRAAGGGDGGGASGAGRAGALSREHAGGRVRRDEHAIVRAVAHPDNLQSAAVHCETPDTGLEAMSRHLRKLKALGVAPFPGRIYVPTMDVKW